MTGIGIRETALLSGVVFLAAALFAQPTFAAKPQNPSVLITEVAVNADLTEMTITGENFDNKDPVEVLLGEFGPLVVVSESPTEIVAELPAGIGAGDILLSVITGPGDVHRDEYDLTIGAVGPEGPQGDQGPQGDPGFTQVYSRSLTDLTVGPGTTRTLNPVCDAGDVVLGGGFAAPPPQAAADVVESSPNASDRWACTVRTGQSGLSLFVCVARCADITP